MEGKNIWLMKIINPFTDVKITIYENGLVYGSEYNNKLFILTDDAVYEIKKYINQSLYNLKKQERTIQNKSGVITKINDTSRKHRNIKIYDWEHENEIIKLITNKNNIKKNLLCN